MALELTPDTSLTREDRVRIEKFRQMTDEEFTVVVVTHLRELSADSRRPLWSRGLAPRTLRVLDVIAGGAPVGSVDEGEDLRTRARAERSVLGAALAG